MSSISIDVPTLRIDNDDLQNLVKFIFKHEHLLKEFGAIKLQPYGDCAFGIKKRQKFLCTCVADKQILKSNRTGSVYSVQNLIDVGDSSAHERVATDETAFWSSLSSMKEDQRQLNTSLVPGKSFFYQKPYAKYFDIHRVPAQSLLKLAKRKHLGHCAPCTKRAHGPGAVFPLRCTRQNLFSLDYHHEGGNHHWYVIPTRERKELQQIMGKDDLAHCLTHGQVFIHPSLLDKHQIRYHRIVQRPNEFVVLSAGSLAQSFTEDASWSESVEFALPSWIEEGHASMPNPSCHCAMPPECASQTIDPSLFRSELIQKYTANHLGKYIDNRSTVLPSMDDVHETLLQTPNSWRSDSVNAEHTLHTDLNVIFPMERPELFIQSPSPSTVTPSLSSCISKDDDNGSYTDNAQVFYELLEEGNFPPAPYQVASNLSVNDFIWNEHMFDEDERTKELHSNRTQFTSIFDDLEGDYNMETNNISFEEIITLLPSAEERSKAKSPPVISTNASVTSVHNPKPLKRKRQLNRCIHDRRTLFVSGLNSHINKHDIYNQFPGCVSVALKRCRSTTHLKYAFVVHRTHIQAIHNLHRPIDRSLLGSECHVEHATSRSRFSNDHQFVKSRKVAVTQIPEDVNEDDLGRLFGNSHILKYCPARRLESTAESGQTKTGTKVLTGYAFLLFDTEQQAADTIKHPDRYQINGQSLSISPYRC